MNADERLLDLVAFLLASRRPVSSNEIFLAFEDQYQGSYEARDRKFSRDKEALRALGIPLITKPLDEDPTESGYVIDRSAFYLPDLVLTPDERAALFAVGAEAAKSAFPLHDELLHALTKLRSIHSGGEERAQPTLFATAARGSKHEDVIARAVTERRRLRIVYPPNQGERTFDPYVFSARRSRFAVVGFCHLRQGIRTFFAERMMRCELAAPDAKPGQFEVPPQFDPGPHLPVYPWQVRIHEPISVELEFSPDQSEIGPRALGLVPGEPCLTTNLDGLVAQVLAVGGGVRIRGPDSARERLCRQLSSLAQALESQS